MNQVSVAMELRQLSNLCMRYMDHHSHKKYIDTITGTNSWIIGYLYDKGDEDIFQKDLEKKFGITRSTASKVINLMISKGLIEHHNVNYDARLKKLVLTEKAKELVSIMRRDSEKLERVLISDISKEDMILFKKCMQKMKNNIKKNI